MKEINYFWEYKILVWNDDTWEDEEASGITFGVNRAAALKNIEDDYGAGEISDVLKLKMIGDGNCLEIEECKLLEVEKENKE